MRRPTGVTIIAILAILGGLFALCGGTVSVVGSGLSGIGKILGFDNLRPGALFLDGGISLALGVLNIIFGFGAFQLKHWAWLLGIGIELATLVDKGIDFAQGHGRVIAGMSFIVALIILAYLLSGPVRRAFGQAAAPEQLAPSANVSP